MRPDGISLRRVRLRPTGGAAWAAATACFVGIVHVGCSAPEPVVPASMFCIDHKGHVGPWCYLGEVECRQVDSNISVEHPTAGTCRPVREVYCGLDADVPIRCWESAAACLPQARGGGCYRLVLEAP